MRGRGRSSIRHKIMSDPFLRTLGIRVQSIGRGSCRASLRIRENMVNFHGVAHGAVVFALADAAFAAAGNSDGTKALALNIEASYRRPSQVGDSLTALAREESKGGKTALYHIRVVNQRREVVAVFHGTVFRTGERF